MTDGVQQVSPSRYLIDPELRAMVDAFPHTTLSDQTLPAFRDLVASYVAGDLSVSARTIDLTHHFAKGPPGAPDVRLAVYRPSGISADLPVIFQIHGGGFVAGKVDALESRHREIAATMRCCLVSVDYRLAPETKFPGAIEDCYAALGWLVGNAKEIGVSPETIVLMGESAGGGLAAALALLARDRGEYRPAFQHLTYPMLDDRTAFNADSSPYVGEFLWTKADNLYGWTALLGEAAGKDDVSPYAAPARAIDISRLPPAFIMTGALDLFADESVSYARRLIGAGVPTELHVYPGGFHGFDLASAQISKAARKASGAALARALHGPKET